MKCQYCQAPIAWGAKFCSHCGLRPGEAAKQQIEVSKKQSRHYDSAAAPLGCLNIILILILAFIAYVCFR
jgi:predicted amidophosphoribosyltransferase